MHDQRSLVRAVRGPLLLFAIAILGIAAAFVLDETSVREYALVIGAPALTVLLPVAIIWLVVAAIVHTVRR